MTLGEHKSSLWLTTDTPYIALTGELWGVLNNCRVMNNTGLILGLRPANERRRYKVTPSLIGWTQI